MNGDNAEVSSHNIDEINMTAGDEEIKTDGQHSAQFMSASPMTQADKAALGTGLDSRNLPVNEARSDSRLARSDK